MFRIRFLKVRIEIRYLLAIIQILFSEFEDPKHEVQILDKNIRTGLELLEEAWKFIYPIKV